MDSERPTPNWELDRVLRSVAEDSDGDRDELLKDLLVRAYPYLWNQNN
jgi:hypothetical protein